MYEQMGIEVVATITGDGRIGDIQRAHGASLNVVQSSGSMTALAKDMKERFGIPFLQVSYVGIEDTAAALYAVAKEFAMENILLAHRKLSATNVPKFYQNSNACVKIYRVKPRLFTPVARLRQFP